MPGTSSAKTRFALLPGHDELQANQRAYVPTGTSQACPDMNEAANQGGLAMTGARGSAERCRTTLQHQELATLQATSTSLAISAAVSFASFAQRILVETGLPQFSAHIPPNWPLAGLTVSAAISFAPLPQRVLVFAGKPQLLALPTSTVVHSDASRSNFNGLGKGRDRNYKKSSCRCGAERIVAHSIQHFLILQLLCTDE
jgi:hypothetical protein